MPLIWCSISGHGFGHAAQVVPVLNELARRTPGTKVILRTTVLPQFFQGRLEVEWELRPAQQDVGCVQAGPLRIDIGATWTEHLRFHQDWQSRVLAEERAIRSSAPDLLLADISYLAIEAGARAQVPTVGLCNLSWDLVLDPFREPDRSDQTEIFRQIHESYALADLMIRLAPGLPMRAFRKLVDVGPIALPMVRDETRLRRAVGADMHERVVVISFGGIALESLPFERMEEMAGYRFVVAGPVPDGCKRTVSTASLPLPFESVLVSADIILIKPGYSTVIEAVAYRKRVVYVKRRDVFADERSLIEYLHRHGCAVELAAEDFASGSWKDALDKVWEIPEAEHAPFPTGASEAAALLSDYL